MRDIFWVLCIRHPFVFSGIIRVLFLFPVSMLGVETKQYFAYFFSIIFVFGLLFGGFVPVGVFAQGENPENPAENPENPSEVQDPNIPQLVNPVGTTNINSIVARITKALLAMIGTISFLIFVISGIQLILSGGVEDKVKKAKDSMVWAVIGIAIALGSYAILTNVLDVLTKGR